VEQSELVRYAIENLEAHGIKYMLVGSMASSTYGDPRSTRDIDIVVDVEPDQVDVFCRIFPSPEFYLSRDAALEAIRRRKQFNVIHPTTANKIDFMLSQRTAWGRSQVERRRKEQIFPGMIGYTAAPEDIIISKMMYYQEGGSDKHLRDCAAMLKVSGDKIDRQYLAEWSEKLRLASTWQAIQRRVDESGTQHS
jgi:hypothetical protein